MAEDKSAKKDGAKAKDVEGKKGKKAGKDEPVEPEQLSEEDEELKANLELMVTRTQDPEPALQKAALEGLRKEIRTATSSMTSVPKPLKFLRPHYAKLKEVRSLPAQGLTESRSGRPRRFKRAICSCSRLATGLWGW
jgi:26S proteasome regulatory subunit N1